MRTVNYYIKFKYPININKSTAEDDLIKLIFHYIDLTSISNEGYTLGMLADDKPKWSVISIKFKTYGKKLMLDRPSFKLDYDYVLYIDEVDDENETYTIRSKDNQGQYDTSHTYAKSFCPNCNNEIFKHMALDTCNEQAWMICPSCHEIVTVYRNGKK